MADLLRPVYNAEQFDSEFSGAEVLVPAQFHGKRNSAAALESLRRLMVAVLVDAMRCVQSRFNAHQSARRQEYADARSWIFSDEDRALFSFKAICDTLDMDPNAIRKYLAQWEENRLSGENPRRIMRRAAVSLSKRMSQ
jgi:hypothetical protein